MYRTVPRGVLFSLLALALTGCEQGYRCETEVLPDGRVKRAVCQPDDAAPAAARDPKIWEQVTYARSQDDLDRPWRHASLWDFPAREKLLDTTYVLARGTFPTVKDVPDDIAIRPMEGASLPDGKLIREYTRTDYGFLVEHEWRETLTDCVTFEGMKEARKELVDLLIEGGKDVFEALLGDKYDASDLVQWVNIEGRAILSEVTDSMFRRKAGGPPTTDEDVAAILERHGLNLKNRERFLDEAERDKAVEQLVVELIARRLRARDGHLVTPEEVRALGKTFENPNDAGLEEDAKVKAAMKRFAARHGGDDVVNTRVVSLAHRVLGLYTVRFIAPLRFEMSLTLPGQVVETNGEIIDTNRVRWRFKGNEAYPSGYVMRCRSFESDRKTQTLLGADQLGSREGMIWFVDLVGDDERVLDVLRRCRDQGSFKPLLQFRKTLAGETESTDTVMRVWNIINQLKVPLD